MRHSYISTFAVLAIVWSTQSAAAVTTHDDSVRVTVRIYRAPEGDQWLEPALAQAAALLSAVSVRIEWVSCGGGSGQPLRCRVAPAVGELALRVVRTPGDDRDPMSMPLGDSVIDRRAKAGTLATIYADRIVWLADQSRMTVATLAGRAVAHELGHLLMATPVHDTVGLMRAHWTVPELARDDPRDWVFTAADAKAIRRRASREAAPRQVRSLLASPSSSFAVGSVDAEID
jgi:hypothetical protein